jgi:TusA-related sulfurtransferase
MEPDRKIDCIGLYCPEPIFRTRMALDDMEKGQILEVKADDPAAEEDLKRLARRLGHEVLSVENEKGVLTIVLKK